MTRDLLADARACLAGATAPGVDPDVRVVYVARARALLVQLRVDVEAFGRELDVLERTIIPPKASP